MRQHSTHQHPRCETSSRGTSLLADLVDAMADQLEAGQSVDIESLVGQHADLAQPLRAAYESLVGLHAAADLPQAGDSIQPRRLGDFQLAGEIGRGGMGIVYEAEHISLGRLVAVKVLPFAALMDQRQLARFKKRGPSCRDAQAPGHCERLLGRRRTGRTL